jgi:hypothetical protein
VKKRIVILVCMIMGATMGAQQTQRASTEDLVVSILNKGLYDGFSSKQLGHTGDSGAVALTKAIGGRQLSGREIASAALVVDLSFASPKGIENESDRLPRTALFVLQYLDQQSHDAGQKKRIAEIRNRLQQYVRSQ